MRRKSQHGGRVGLDSGHLSVQDDALCSCIEVVTAGSRIMIMNMKILLATTVILNDQGPKNSNPFSRISGNEEMEGEVDMKCSLVLSLYALRKWILHVQVRIVVAGA